MTRPGGERPLGIVLALGVALLLGAAIGLPPPLLILLAAALVAASWFALVQVREAGESLRILERHAQTLADGGEEVLVHQAGPGGITELSNALERLGAQLATQRGRLSSQRDLLEAVVTGMEESILVIRPGGRLLLANGPARHLLALPEEAEEKPLIDVVRLPPLIDAVQQALRGKAAPIEIAGFGVQKRILVGRAAPLPAGGSAAAVVVIRDVTELRALEAMRRNFVASASHELRTPVAAIRGYAETLASGALEDAVAAKRFVAGLSRQAERLSALIDDLLDLSRVESGGLHLEPRPLSLRVAIRRMTEIMADRIQEKKLDLRILEPEGELFVQADPRAIDMVVGNLLDNAIKYSPAGGALELEGRRAGASIRIEVRDQGPGIDLQHQGRIFERFYRVDSGRAREVGGTGLGLAIAKHVVQQSGGDVGVQSRPGKGSIFWVVLPAASASTASRSS